MRNSIRFILVMIVFITGVSFGGNTTRVAVSDTPVKKVSKYPNMEVTPDLTAEQMWKALCEYVPPGVTVTSLSISPPIHWLRKQCGSYKYIPPILNVQMKDGIILTSGLATNCLGPNSQTGITKDHGTMNTDPDLNNAITYTVMDPAVFEIKFTSDKTIPGFSFVFCFGTDEYDEFVNTQFNDVFICMFDGKNICFDSQGKLICVNNTFFNVDNKDGRLNLEYDGMTCVLQTSQVIIPGNHTIKFAIADASDGKLDAGVFLNNFRFDTTITGTTPVINIIDNQQFAIPENTPGGSLVGVIAKLCAYGPVSLQKINTVPEFYCNGWNMTVSSGVVFNASVTNQYVMKIKATLDTVWNSKPWIVYDTADMTIRITTDNPWPQISKAVIYDFNGNGIGDSVAVSFPFDFPDTYILKKADFTWPANQTAYAENITNADLLTRRLLGFGYAPQAAAQKWTQGQSSISISIDSLGKTSTHAGTLEDGIGPVLWNARVVKRYVPRPDTFRVALSEPVNVSAISGKSFILIKKSPVKRIEIEPVAGTMLNLSADSSIQFLVADLLADAPATGDSLQILSTGPVIDKKSNRAHKNNPPVPIEFLIGSLEPWPQIDNAVIYNKNGNGIGDSLRIHFNGTFIDSMTVKTASYSWPENQINYVETISAGEISNKNTIAFTYDPGAAAPVWTLGKSTVVVAIDSLGKSISRSGEIADGIGPLLTGASVMKRYAPGNDTFYVKITEPVFVAQISGNAFVLIKKNHVREIAIAPIGAVKNLGNEDYIQFAAPDLGSDAPAPGDSLKILHTGPVADKLNNKAHKDNIPVPLAFLNSNVPVDKAYYYDINGDGVVDRARLEFADTVVAINELVFDVAWTDIGVSAKSVAATFEPGSVKTIVLDLQNAFNNSAAIRDKTSGDMECTVTYKATGGIAACGVIDKAGPVITKATYYLSKFTTARRADTDRLAVQFSENISTIPSTRPFLLKILSGTGYYLELLQTEKTASTATFTVTAIQGVNSVTDGDSIWINENENVQDAAANPQAVKDNKRVELIIMRPPFELIPYVIGPTEPSKKALPQGFQISNGRISQGTVIILEPDIKVPLNILSTVACKVKIFDAVGNELASGNGYNDQNDQVAISPLQKGPNNMIVILWSDLNFQKRSVGEGAYLGVIDIVYPDGRNAVKRVVIPIKG